MIDDCLTLSQNPEELGAAYALGESWGLNNNVVWIERIEVEWHKTTREEDTRGGVLAVGEAWLEEAKHR